MTELTQILDGIARGDEKCARELLPAVYDELRRLAAKKLAQENPGHTLQPTALVHEAYLRLVASGDSPRYADRSHFFRAAATAMRRILVDEARKKNALKRGGAGRRQELDVLAAPERPEEVMALDEALERLAARNPMHAALVELRYFAGLSGDQAAEALGISPATADRHWQFARAWLFAEIRGA